jgi:RNase P subunit RPR2
MAETTARVPCEACSDTFASVASMRKHYLVKHTPPTENLIACTLCDFKHKIQAKVNSHFKSVHQNVRPHACSQCPATFKQGEKLRIHVATQHNNETRFQCATCDYKTYYADSYKRHMHEKHPEGGARALRGEQHSHVVPLRVDDDKPVRNGRQLTIVDKFAAIFPDAHDEFTITCIPGAVKPYLRVDAALLRIDRVTVLLDIDEKQHRDASKYSVSSELERMKDGIDGLRAATNGDMSVFWLRFNPDTYTINGIRINSSIDERVAAGSGAIKRFVETCSPRQIQIGYVGFDAQNDVLEITSHADYTPLFCSMATLIKCPSDEVAAAKSQTVHRNKRHAAIDESQILSLQQKVDASLATTPFDPSTLVCPHCNDTFFERGKVLRHIREVHDGMKRAKSSKTFTCTYAECGAFYSTQQNLTNHVNRVHLNLGYTCDECSKEFSSPSNLATHQKTVHQIGLTRLLKCPHCEYTTPYGNQVIRKHVERNHASTA